MFVAAMVLIASWIGGVFAMVEPFNGVLTQTSLAGIEPLARRTRNLWLVVTALAVIPLLVIEGFGAQSSTSARLLAGAAITPFALAVRAQLVMWRVRRRDAWAVVGERHVVVLCPGRTALWLRANPARLAKCAMPRATIVRSQR